MTTHHDIELYPHNQETYDKIIKAWKTQNRVATVQATGTGKTFLILKCLFTYPDVNKVVLAPSHHILDQLCSKVDELPNTTLLTYSKLSYMSEDEIKGLDANMIVLDEFHRCGADKWGSGVQNLLNTFTDAKLLGLTATPIRHLDNGRDMSDELFEGNVVTTLTLPQAIVKDILPMPKYISALYSFDEEIDNLKEKINKSTNKDEEKEELCKIVDGLKHKLEKSNGVPSILKKYLKHETGKFIVFCKDGKHLKEMMGTAKQWFNSANIGKEIEVYSVMSDKEDNEEELHQFVENKNNDNVRLLFSIEMLNEGLHVEDVTGVILLRPTTSPIIYFQQIGRALQAGNKKQPFIFDLVNNFNSIGSKQFSSELDVAISEENTQRSLKEIESLDINEFSIYDEIKEISDVFLTIEDRIINTNEGLWNKNFNLLKEYKIENGHLNVPHSCHIKGANLGVFVNHQRQLYRKGELLESRKNKLIDIGLRLKKEDNSWGKSYDLLLEFFEINGHTNIPQNNDSGLKLGQWVRAQRQSFKKGKLSTEQISKLEKIGVTLNVRTTWEDYYELLLKYYKTNRSSNLKNNYVVNGIKLGLWLRTQKEMYRKGKLSKERIKKLELIAVRWSIDKIKKDEETWLKNYTALCNYYKENKHIEVPCDYHIEGLKLRNWMSAQRALYKKGKLITDKIEKLNSIGFKWEPHESEWNNKYELLRSYKLTYGNCNVPISYEIEGVKLGVWVNNLRHLYKKGLLSRKDRLVKLNELNFA